MRQREGAYGERLHDAGNVFDYIRQVVEQQIDNVETGEERPNEPWVMNQLGVDKELHIRNHAGVADPRGDYAVSDPIITTHKAALHDRVHQFAAEQFAWSSGYGSFSGMKMRTEWRWITS